MEENTIIIDETPVGKKVQTNPDRYLFAKWMRRAMKMNRIRVRDAQEELGVERSVLNNWIEDGAFSDGSPSYPDEQDCHAIANLFGVGPDKVIEMVEISRDASLNPVLVDENKKPVDDDNKGNVIGE